MSTNEPDLGPGLGPRKPRAELRHWSTYTSVGEWYTDHRGYVPIQMAAGISRTMKERGVNVPRGVHVSPAPSRDRPYRPCRRRDPGRSGGDGSMSAVAMFFIICIVLWVISGGRWPSDL